MIEIDGSYLEGGGQIIRTSVALSCLTKKPIHIFNIRAGRKQPGLKAQHLAALLAVGDLCNAKTQGAKIGSKEIYFHPNKINREKLKINISTAGSVGLVLQTIFLVSVGLEKNLKIEIEGGGTFGKWSPSVA
ncbi:MAG: RNA 3'-phosphate cyclase, partial [Candidatus Aenigmarchaeota archaeon]|nr:RNA 3'-phosphate cyclase [Candidatus Aenigmarchaeota archaeon]